MDENDVFFKMVAIMIAVGSVSGAVQLLMIWMRTEHRWRSRRRRANQSPHDKHLRT